MVGVVFLVRSLLVLLLGFFVEVTGLACFVKVVAVLNVFDLFF